MKKSIILLLAVLGVMILSSSAFAGEAVDITHDCTIRTNSGIYKGKTLTDKKYTTKYQSNEVKEPFVQLDAPVGSSIHGLYICFADIPKQYSIQYLEGDQWVDFYTGTTNYLHVYYKFGKGYQSVRLVNRQNGKSMLQLNELFAFSSGTAPDWVQQWEPTCEKADIMFVATHPDDEVIFFGGAIATYAAEKKKNVVVVHFTGSNAARRSELLNALWHMGLRNYPVIGKFPDSYTLSIEDAYKTAGGQKKVIGWIVELYRKYRPQVVVSHDPKGEYGHGQHQMVSDACLKAYSQAAEEYEYVDSIVEYGTWQVKKLYLHLAGNIDNQIILNWDIPLQSKDNKTAIQLAEEAFEYHVTQHTTKYNVKQTGVQYDNRKFGLIRTKVGEDMVFDDFLENISDTSQGETQTIAETANEETVEECAYKDILPELNERGFIDQGEFVYFDDPQGLYIFIDQSCKIIIERKYDESKPMTWYTADIWTDLEKGALPQTIQYDEEKMDKARSTAAENALKHKSVFAMNTDYYTYRIGSKSAHHIGVQIRDGKILYDDRYPDTSPYFPNLDVLAFFPDGSIDVFASHEFSAQEYLDMGAYMTYSFGPYLIKNGKISERSYKSSNTNNPRCAFGMVEPGHYVAILAEGRIKRSKGITIRELTLLMRDKGCTVAFNLDGGQTGAMCFMGKQLNMIASDTSTSGVRPTSEILSFGYSEQVGTLVLE